MKTLNSNKKAIAIAIGVTAALVLMAALVVEKQNSEHVYDTQITSEFKDAFMEGCVVDGNADYTSCDCTYKYLTGKLGSDKFIQESIEYNKTGVFTPTMIEAVNACFY